MCISAFYYQPNDVYRLIALSNRDEFYKRLSMPAHWWADGILAGKDLEGGGTWLGVGGGRFANLTNYRDLSLHREGRPSRGLLVSRFLSGKDTLAAFIELLFEEGPKYNPFNLMLYDDKSNRLYYYSNMTNSCRRLGPGLYVLSNHLLDTPWPKMERLRSLLGAVDLARPSAKQLFEILKDDHKPPLSELPQTGIAKELEFTLSSIFVKSDTYGTRFQTAFLLEDSGVFSLFEQALDHSTGNWSFQSFQSDFKDLKIT